MKQWELWKFPYPSEDNPYWFVIISPDAWCQRSDQLVVNGLACTTLRPLGRDLKSFEVRLDSADGLDWDTVVKCAYIHELRLSSAKEKLGPISILRRREIIRKLNGCIFP